jgi:hypothetical protein
MCQPGTIRQSTMQNEISAEMWNLPTMADPKISLT